MPTSKLIYDGVTYDDKIVAGEGGLDMRHSMVGETLSVDTLEVAVGVDGESAPTFEENAIGQFYAGYSLIGQYYAAKFERVASKKHVMRFYSAIWLLGQSMHYGGMYNGELLADVLSDIMGDVVDYTVDPALASIRVYQYLPYATRRNNLQMFLMACGAAVRNGADGSLYITTLSSTATGAFDASRAFVANGKVIDQTPCTAVQITEHNYVPSSDEIKLFEDAALDTRTITFREPVHDLAITGGTITASGVNYCTFTGTGMVTITGKRYTHITRVVTHGTPPTGSPSDVVKTVTDNTLIGPLNAAQVAESVYKLLRVKQSIQQEVVVGSERPGDVVQVINPRTEEMVSACIKSMSIQVGKSEMRAVCEFLVGYTPPGPILGYEDFDFLTGSGSWTVPEGVYKIRIIVCESGKGGDGGSNGTKPAVGGSAGLGGAAGAFGPGGRIYEAEIEVTPGDIIVYNAPLGTAGGAGSRPVSTGTSIPGEAAAAPDPTTFGPYSSDFGRRYTDGYYEPRTGLTIGANGKPGAKGGDGAGSGHSAGDVTYDGTTWAGGTNITGAGGGGGAAVGANGENASTTSTQNRGGSGADAANRTDSTGYGQGGDGGHGGGGGGGANNSTGHTGVTGSGGEGSDGGDGGAGCIIVYYTEGAARVLESISITTQPTNRNYEYGDTFDPTGMVVTAMYDDASTAAVTGYTCSPSTLSTIGTQTITVSYTYHGVTKTATTTVTVARKTLSAIPSQSGTLAYTGSAQSPDWNNYDPTKLTIGGVTSATNVGSYNATFTPTANYRWSDGTTTAKTASWAISAGVLTIPSQSGTLTYTGSSQSPMWSGYDSTKMTLGGTTSGTDAGSYNATFTLAANYSWSDGTTGVKTVSWSIGRASIANTPSQSGTLTYTGSSQSPSWSNYNSSQLTIGGTTSGTNAGSYTATFTPKSNYQWSDGSTGAKSVNWSIGKAAGSLSISPTTMTLDATTPSKTIAVTRAGDGAISAVSSDTSKATVSVSDTTVTVTGVASGSVTITVSVAAGTNHLAPADKTCAVTVSLSVPLSDTFSANTWEAIIGACQSGSVPAAWVVGNSKAMTINGTSYDVIIIGKGHDTYSTGGTAPLTLMLKDCYGTKYAMNSKDTNSGGWASCAMRTTHLPSILALMPSEVKTGIKEVNKLTSAGSGDSTINTSADKLFLLSEKEIYGSLAYSVNGEGTQYAYYSAGNSNTKNFGGSATSWRGRSPTIAYYTDFCEVSSSKYASRSGASAQRGVSFCFCF